MHQSAKQPSTDHDRLQLSASCAGQQAQARSAMCGNMHRLIDQQTCFTSCPLIRYGDSQSYCVQAGKGRLGVMAVLLEHAQNTTCGKMPRLINQRNYRPSRPLITIAYSFSHPVQASKGRLGVMGVLLDHGAKLSAADSMGNTPLHRAAAAGKVAARVSIQWC